MHKGQWVFPHTCLRSYDITSW